MSIEHAGAVLQDLVLAVCRAVCPCSRELLQRLLLQLCEDTTSTCSNGLVAAAVSIDA
jgi:GTP cyclohydrolase FolE2